MRRAGRRLLGLALPLLLAAGALGEVPVPPGAAGVFEGGEARLLAHPDDPPDGPALRLGVLFDLEPGWHLYWRNPGQSGLAPALRWEVAGAEVGAIAWPAPQTFREADGLLTTYGYAGSVLLASVARPYQDVDGARRARVSIDALLCRTECIPARLALARALGAEPDAATAARVRAVFASAAARVPTAPAVLGVALEAHYSQSAIRPGDRFRAAIAVHSCRSAPAAPDCVDYAPAEPPDAFFPDAIAGVELEASAAPRRAVAPHASVLMLEGRADPEDPGRDQRLRGVLALRAEGGARRYVEVDLPLPRARAGAAVARLDLPATAASAPARAAPPALAHALLLALLGGLVLNLMPCVLPVLAIKVFALAELAHRSRRDVLAHAAAYAAGVLLSMSLLASLVALLRAAGASVGWGFQFQQPLFVAAVCTLLVVFALNLFGVFDFEVYTGRLAHVGQRSSGPSRSFFEGLLAVVLATPCTAPFLGTAVGFAFASPTPVVYAIFLAIGLGLAAPTALIALAPAWSSWIPRAGPWMLKLRIGLGFALLASAVWLLWIVGRAVGSDAMAALVGFLVAVAFATWLYGVVQATRRPGLTRGFGLALLALVVCGLNTIALEPDGAAAAARAPDSPWRSFEAAAVAAELRAGRPVFVRFTADWCITCKLNERVVIAHERVRREFERLGVALFEADWTRRDERIRAELARFGKAGVPMYLVYAPHAPGRPQLLPELLTVERVLHALREAAAGQSPSREERARAAA